MGTRQLAAQKTIEECFWGDYQLDAKTLLSKLDEKNEKFSIFILSKIVDNASHPSGLVRELFPREDIEKLIFSVAARAGTRRERTLLSLRNNVLGEKTYIPELSWKR